MCSPVLAAPTNFFRPGEKNLNGQLADMGEGLLITELGGLHARANPVSGDFSLIAKGFRLKNGKQGAPVEQVTVCREFLSTAERYPDSRKRSGISKAEESVLPTWMPEPFMLPENEVYYCLVCLIRSYMISLTVRKSGTSDAFTWFVKIGEPKETGKAECFLNEEPILHPRQLK